MKKFYVLLAAAAMLASCAETDLVNPIPESEPQAIGFETFAQKATKAENSGAEYSNGFIAGHHDYFKVWAYKNVTDDLVFNGTEVKSEDYSYSPTHYWDKTATTYQFYAAAPSSTTPTWEFVGNTTNKDQAYFKLTNAELNATNFVSTPSTNEITTFKGLGGDVDWMIADKCPIENTDFGNKVQLNFIHILSRLNIIVKKSDAVGTTEITLNSITVKNLKTKGSFDESRAVADGSGKTLRWDNLSETKDYSFASNFPLETSGNFVLQSLVIPQAVTFQDIKTDGSSTMTEPYIIINYTISGEKFVAYYNLAEVFGATSGNTIPFNEGWQNTLTITIAPAAISFASNVALWADGTEKGENIN